MIYQTFEPNEVLSEFVNCYWTLENPKEVNPQRQTIVPDGCMEMIFHCGDLYRQFDKNEKSIVQPRCFVFGQLTEPLTIAPTGETNIFAIRFSPHGFLPFATIPIKEMENRATSLEILFGSKGIEIEQQIVNAMTTKDRIKHIETFLSNQMSNVEYIHSTVQSAVETILSAKGQFSVGDLSKQIRVNRRQLERKFSSAIGLSPKQLSKIIRLQATLKMLLSKEFTSLTALSYQGEFYDQAHFIKDFKEFTGMTPKEFYGDSIKMSSLFYGVE